MNGEVSDTIKAAIIVAAANLTVSWKQESENTAAAQPWMSNTFNAFYDGIKTHVQAS